MRRVTLADAAFGTAVVIGTLAALWLASVAVEAGLWLGTTPRTALAVVVGGATLGLCARYLARPVGRLLGLVSSPPDEAIARTIGDAYPEVSDRLLNLLQLAEGRSSHAPAPLVDHAVQRLAEDVESVPFEDVEDFDRARSAFRLASLPVVGVLAFVLVAPSTFFGASERLLAPQTHFQKPAPFQLAVQPGNVRLVKGDSLQITANASGAAPERVTVAMQARGEQRVETVSVAADSGGVFRHTIAGVREPLRYRVEADPVRTAWYDAEVMARPLVRTLRVTATPPRYTGLPERTLDANVGNVTGLPGTQVSVSAALGGPSVDRAALVFDDGERRVPLDVSEGTATGTFTLREEGTYAIELTSTQGVSNRDPIRYDVSLRADAQPSASFLAPEPEATVDDDLVKQLRVRLSDDFGFSQLKLYYRLAEQRFGEPQTEFSSMDLPLDRPRTLDQEVIVDWLLAQDSGLDLVPGDVVEYYVRVWDNDAVAGYKAASTAKQRLRLPSLAESFEQLDADQEEAESQMQDLQEEAEEIDRQFRELRDELRSKQQADWEDQRQLEQIQQKQKSMDQKVNELSKQMQSITQQMQEENLTSPETTKKYEELQRVIEEIDSPELQKALQKLQQSMKNMDMRQMQKAMEDFEFSEQQYQDRLQRALDLFKNLKAQQKLEEMSRRAGELSEVEKQLAEETKKRMDESAETNEESQQQDANAADGEQRDSTQTSAPENQSPESETENRDPDDRQSDTDSQNADSQNQETQNQKPETGNQKPNEDLAREQERAAERMKELMKEMQEAAQDMEDVSQSPKQQMQQMQQQMKKQNMPQQMKQNAQQLRQQQMNDAQQGQQRMQQQLQQMQQQLKKMKKGMQGQQMQVNMAGLQSALDNILRLSQDQESLRGTVQELSSNSPTLRRYAQDQKDLSTGLQTVSDSLQNLARRIPQMSRKVQEETGNALREMESATSDLTERSAPQASSHQKGSMMHLNELALMLSDLLSQMQNASGQGGGMSMQQMMQQMQQMSGQQQKVNRQIQQFLNDMQGNRLSKSQKERLQQLAKQQQQIQQDLKELMNEGGTNADRMLGDLNKIAEQMEKTIQELQQGQQSGRTVERQKQILTRMLQAQQSLQTQGKKQERKGQASESTFDRDSPGEMTPQEQAESLRRDLIRALESGYAPDYEELIKRYFELLQQQPER